MKYSDLSDFDINKLVGFRVGSIRRGKTDKYYERQCPDYCSEPTHAWPVIVENKLWIQPDCVGDGFWHSYNDDFSAKDKNPLRASMIVFLMMNEESPN